MCNFALIFIKTDMKFIFSFYLLFFTVFLNGQDFYQYFRDESLRIDYYHSGNDTSESIRLKCFKNEPYFSGPLNCLTDPFDYGNYKFEVFETAGGKLIFSRGYSTLFTEWQYTPEAKTKTKTFEESLILPYPVVKIRVDVSSRAKSGVFNKIFSLTFDPLVDTAMDFKTLYSCRNISQNEDKADIRKEYHKKLDLVIIPEGYRSQDSAKLYKDVNFFKNSFLQCSPYSLYRNSIQFWVINAFSQDSGTDLPPLGIMKNTLVNTSFYTFNTQRYLMTEDFHHLKDIAAHVPYDQIYILVNTKLYGGGAIYNYYSVCVSNDEFSDYIFNHEFGHAFAGLGDEYFDSDVSTQGMYPPEIEPWEPNLTTLKAFSSKWEDMVDEGLPIPTPTLGKYAKKVGAYEGGGYQAKGVYRPFQDCSMKSIMTCNFCPVCSRAIRRKLDFFSSK